jgi:hypothetical protein
MAPPAFPPCARTTLALNGGFVPVTATFTSATAVWPKLFVAVHLTTQFFVPLAVVAENVVVADVADVIVRPAGPLSTVQT